MTNRTPSFFDIEERRKQDVQLDTLLKNKLNRENNYSDSVFGYEHNARKAMVKSYIQVILDAGMIPDDLKHYPLTYFVRDYIIKIQQYGYRPSEFISDTYQQSRPGVVESEAVERNSPEFQY